MVSLGLEGEEPEDNGMDATSLFSPPYTLFPYFHILFPFFSFSTQHSHIHSSPTNLSLLASHLSLSLSPPHLLLLLSKLVSSPAAGLPCKVLFFFFCYIISYFQCCLFGSSFVLVLVMQLMYNGFVRLLISQPAFFFYVFLVGEIDGCIVQVVGMEQWVL